MKKRLPLPIFFFTELCPENNIVHYEGIVKSSDFLEKVFQMVLKMYAKLVHKLKEIAFKNISPFHDSFSSPVTIQTTKFTLK